VSDKLTTEVLQTQHPEPRAQTLQAPYHVHASMLKAAGSNLQLATGSRQQQLATSATSNISRRPNNATEKQLKSGGGGLTGK